MDQGPYWVLPEDLAELYRDDRDCGVSILESFVEQIRLSLERIHDRLEAGDGKTLARELHRLKGSLLQLGASRTGIRCKEFELAVPSESIELWRIRLDQIQRECATVLIEVEKLLSQKV